MAENKALVLGGGGLAGIAWATGVLTGLAEHGIDVTDADVIIGTSAGSAVAAQLGRSWSLAELFERQVDPASANRELVPYGLDMAKLWEDLLETRVGVSDPTEQRRRVGTLALQNETVPESQRREVVAGRLPEHTWPERDLRITAVNARTGEPVVFDRTSGVDLVDAVSASCAVPGVWPPVTIGTERFIDGGVRTMVNADLAEGYARILIVAPLPAPPLDEEVEQLRTASRVELIVPDENALGAFGDNPLDPATRKPSAEAGLAQGREAAAAVAALWNG
jgi:NTE family protein